MARVLTVAMCSEFDTSAPRLDRNDEGAPRLQGTEPQCEMMPALGHSLVR
jgi:hypothetical protein